MKFFIAFLFLSGGAVTSCVELEPIQGTQLVIPLNSGPGPDAQPLHLPVPQTQQPNAPAPPLPTAKPIAMPEQP